MNAHEYADKFFEFERTAIRRFPWWSGKATKRQAARLARSQILRAKLADLFVEASDAAVMSSRAQFAVVAVATLDESHPLRRLLLGDDSDEEPESSPLAKKDHA